MSVSTRLQQSVATVCEQGMMCVHDRSGHQLGAVQLRLALATPRGWDDALVESADATGWVTLRTLDDDTVRVWNHADLSQTLRAGTPVAVHARYDVLVAGDLRLNIAR